MEWWIFLEKVYGKLFNIDLILRVVSEYVITRELTKHERYIQVIFRLNIIIHVSQENTYCVSLGNSTFFTQWTWKLSLFLDYWLVTTVKFPRSTGDIVWEGNNKNSSHSWSIFLSCIIYQQYSKSLKVNLRPIMI